MVGHIPKVSAVVLAAGASRRMGCCKQQLPVKNLTMIEHVVNNVLESSFDDIVIVLGFMANELMKVITSRKAKVVINQKYRLGLSSSLKAGLDAVSARSNAIIFIHADMPLVEPYVFDSLIKEYRKTHALITIPTYKGRRGNPVLFDMSLADEIRRVTGDVGARIVVKRHSEDVHEVEVGSLGVLFDVDTKKQFRIFTKLLEKRGHSEPIILS